jgi:hypothetical protein
MLYGILNIVFGAFVVSPTFIPQEKREQYAEVISWAGIVFIIWGLWAILSSLTHIGLLSLAPVYWILWLVGGLTSVLMGIILGIDLLNKVMKFPEDLLAKILSYRNIIGIAAIVIGVIQLFA